MGPLTLMLLQKREPARRRRRTTTSPHESSTDSYFFKFSLIESLSLVTQISKSEEEARKDL